jgi:hypothetical protein
MQYAPVFRPYRRDGNRDRLYYRSFQRDWHCMLSGAIGYIRAGADI